MVYSRSMPMPEGEPLDTSSQSEPPPQPQLIPFLVASRFHSEPPSARAYFAAQDAIKKHWDNDLSVYRFQLRDVFHVAVLGETPPQPLAQQLRQILAAGDLTTLPEDILFILVARKIQASQQGPWVERHYRERKQ